MLISLYSQVVFGIGVALAIAAFVAIYVTLLASQSQTDVQQRQLPSSPPSTPTSSPSSVSESIAIPQGAAAQQVKTYYMPNPSQPIWCPILQFKPCDLLWK